MSKGDDSNVRMFDGVPLDPIIWTSLNKTQTPSPTPTPRSSSSSTPSPSLLFKKQPMPVPKFELNTTTVFDPELPDNFNNMYNCIRIDSSQADIKKNALSATQFISEALEFYGTKALHGEQKFIRQLSSEEGSEEKKCFEYDVYTELDYWINELDNTYTYLAAHRNLQIQLVNKAIAGWEKLEHCRQSTSQQKSPQFFQKSVETNLEHIHTIIQRQRALWLRRQPQAKCYPCIIL